MGNNSSKFKIFKLKSMPKFEENKNGSISQTFEFENGDEMTVHYENVFDAIEKESITALEYFLQVKKLNPNFKNPNGCTLLHLASEKNLKLVKYLLKKGSDPYCEDQDEGDLPVHRAAAAGKLDIVKYYINKKKINPDVLGHLNRTILHKSSLFNHFDIVKFILKKVDVFAQDSNGQSAKDLAKAKGYDEISDYLNKVCFMYACGHRSSILYISYPDGTSKILSKEDLQ